MNQWLSPEAMLRGQEVQSRLFGLNREAEAVSLTTPTRPPRRVWWWLSRLFVRLAHWSMRMAERG